MNSPLSVFVKCSNTQLACVSKEGKERRREKEEENHKEKRGPPPNIPLPTPSLPARV